MNVLCLKKCKYTTEFLRGKKNHKANGDINTGDPWTELSVSDKRNIQNVQSSGSWGLELRTTDLEDGLCKSLEKSNPNHMFWESNAGYWEEERKPEYSHAAS